jgi:hypothetical protein
MSSITIEECPACKKSLKEHGNGEILWCARKELDNFTMLQQQYYDNRHAELTKILDQIKGEHYE